MINKNYVKVSFLIVLISSFIPACAIFQKQPDNEVLESRVNEYMTAKVNNEWAKVYTFLAPAYQETIAQDAFAHKIRKVRFTSYTVESIEIQPTGTEASVEIQYDSVLQGFDLEFKDNKTTETWIKKRGKWFLDIKPQSDEEKEKGLFR